MLLQCAAPDAVVRLDQSKLNKQEQQQMFDIYHTQQTHESLGQFIQSHLSGCKSSMQVQITTHSKLLSSMDVDQLHGAAGIKRDNIEVLALQAFDTEQQFSRKLR